ERGFGDRTIVSDFAALRPLGEGTKQLVLHAIGDLTARLAATGVDDGSQRVAELVLVLGHLSLHADGRCSYPSHPPRLLGAALFGKARGGNAALHLSQGALALRKRALCSGEITLVAGNNAAGLLLATGDQGVHGATEEILVLVHLRSPCSPLHVGNQGCWTRPKPEGQP